MNGITSNLATLVVESSPLVSIAVTPAASSVPAQIQTSLTAIGTFADGSTQDMTAAANWTSSTASAATVSNATGSKGTVTGITPLGTTTISASFGTSNPIVGSATVSVTNATLVSIAISPSSATISAGTTQKFNAIGTFSDGTTQNLTGQVAWTSGDVTSAVVDSFGLTTGVASGTSTAITANLNGVSSTPAPVSVQ